MNIKSLLLGSAAALFAVSGARAADAIVVAEPEPAEYVKICDVYGAGYYYIPGTETCLSIRGLVRYQISFHEDDDGWRKNVLGRLDINAKSETEYGTLTGYIRLEGNTSDGTTVRRYEIDGPPAAGVDLAYATITLGGLSMGLYDTAYGFALDTSNLGGAEFDVANDDAIHYISYTFDAANGISATLSLEEENNNTDYVPNVVGKINVEQGWGGVTLAVAYDDDDGLAGVDDEFYLKGVARININPQLELAVLGLYESGGDGSGLYSTGYEWSVGAYASYKASEKITLGFGGQYFGDAHANNDWDEWRIGGDIRYQVVDGFATKLQVQYRDADSVVSDGHFEGWLRFERAF